VVDDRDETEEKLTRDTTTPVIIDAVRTPLGRRRGVLSRVRSDDLAAGLLRELANRHPGAVERLEDVYLGAVNQAGEDSRNVARMAVLLAGLPVEVPGITLNRICGSALDAVLLAAKSVICGEGEVYIAGGTESASRAPFVVARSDVDDGTTPHMFDTAVGPRLPNPGFAESYAFESIAKTADIIASKIGISRRDQDEWALRSHRLAARAQDAGEFDDEIVAVQIPASEEEPPLEVTRDEGVRRDTSLEALAKLAPLFSADGSVTAGNAAALADGGAAVLVTSLAMAGSLGVEPLARIVSWGHVGVHPHLMALGPIEATRKALHRAGLTIGQIDLCELNEPFASHVLAALRALELDPEIVNPAGGALALGHPFGTAGARLVTTLVHAMARRRARHGLVTLPVGLGQGLSCILQHT
jgi:acetyl-CoA acetyltransferase family protein